MSLSFQPTRKHQAVALLDLLLRKDNRAYISFYNSLVKETYEDLASLLYADLPSMSPNAHKSSSDGRTPYGETGELWAFSPVQWVLGCWKKD